MQVVATFLFNHSDYRKESGSTVDVISPSERKPEAGVLNDAYSSLGYLKVLEDRRIDANISTGATSLQTGKFLRRAVHVAFC
jgi:hypothetical protein